MSDSRHASHSTTRPSVSNDSNLELIGPIVRLQIQVRSLKQGDRPRSRYDPAPIRSLNSLRVDSGGVAGIDDVTGNFIGDVHHRDHPHSKFRGENGISLGFTSHYIRMRNRFGEHLSDGIAGENILVQANRLLTDQDLFHGVVIMTRQRPVSLGPAEIAQPCVEFSKYCAGYESDRRADSTITEALQFLFDGTRGFYCTCDQDVPRQDQVSVGDLVYRRLAPAS